jgi:hypothetical protein
MARKVKKLITKNKEKVILYTSIIAATAIVVTIVCLLVLPIVNNNIRKDRIISIMNSLKFDSQKCYFHGEYLRGQSMTLNWVVNKNTVYSRNYACNAKVGATVVYVKKLATSAGLIYVGDPYPGGFVHTIDYRTTKYEYLRISISSKLRDDAFYNRSNMGISTSTPDLDGMVNSGPTNVMIDVNLDGIN